MRRKRKRMRRMSKVNSKCLPNVESRDVLMRTSQKTTNNVYCQFSYTKNEQMQCKTQLANSQLHSFGTVF